MCPTRLLIGEPLPFRALDGLGGALRVCNGAFVVAEVKLAEVTLEMFLADMVVHAIDAALHDREVVFDGVCMPKAAAHIFLD